MLYLRQNSHLSNCAHSRVNVCVYQMMQNSVAEKNLINPAEDQVVLSVK